MSSPPRISFGMILLNSEPFLRYNLRALYPFAHEIIVVEGAVETAASIATEDGHSRDTTLATLHQFKAEEDPEDKLQIITRDGFWSEKDEMSQAYAAKATGDYLWQVDGDEFYKAEDMQAIIDMLGADPTITAVSFETITFWGAPDYVVSGWYLERGAKVFHRLFKWGEGYQYVSHRPPTVVDAQGNDMRDLHPITATEMRRRGVYLYHYSLLFPKQVQEKMAYYGDATWTRQQADETRRWAQESYLELNNPFRVHNVYQFPGWLERFAGTPPLAIQNMWGDIQSGQVAVATRDNADVEALLASFEYRWKRALVKRWDYAHRLYLFLNEWRWRAVARVSRLRRKWG